MIDVFKLQAEICKTFANPTRLRIIEALRDQELTASQLLKTIPISKANLSQHMSVLIQRGVVTARREGVNVFYKLYDQRITRACALMRDVLLKRLEENSALIKNIKRIKAV